MFLHYNLKRSEVGFVGPDCCLKSLQLDVSPSPSSPFACKSAPISTGRESSQMKSVQSSNYSGGNGPKLGRWTKAYQVHNNLLSIGSGPFYPDPFHCGC